MRILTFSTLFPNAARPQHGIFVAERLKHLLRSGAVDARVVAPVPWFPVSSRLFPEYSTWNEAPRAETFEGIDVLHPRYPVIPKVGMSVSPGLLALWSRPALRRIMTNGFDFDLIDAHYFYPDGVAAVMIGRWLDKPVVITGRGTDINLFPQYRIPRHLIRWAAKRAAAIATVSDALREALIGLDVPASGVRTLRNGVDVDVFAPLPDRARLRGRLGIGGTSLLMVGNLVDLKGHDRVIQALAMLPEDVELRIAGDGPMRGKLERIAMETGVSNRVRFLGRLDRPALVEAYNAADMLVIASSREGMPNVLLESLACGTPAVATDVGGIREVLNEHAGMLVSDHRPESLAQSIKGLSKRHLSRDAIRGHAKTFSWQATTEGQLRMFEYALQQ